MSASIGGRIDTVTLGSSRLIFLRLVTKRGGWRYGVSTMRYPIRVSTRGVILLRENVIYLLNKLFF